MWLKFRCCVIILRFEVNCMVLVKCIIFCFDVDNG